MSKILSGIVVAKSGLQTISVRVDRKVSHPMYGKQLTRSKKYLVHDPNNSAVIGDKVSIVTGRPVSKTKHYHLVADSKAAKKEVKS